jgi:hypothetical protein
MILRDEIDIFNKCTKFCEDFEKPSQFDLDPVKKALDYLFEETRETERAVTAWHIGKQDYSSLADLYLEDTLDGFLDAAFVALNGAYKVFRYLGQDPEQAKANTIESLMRVCRANLAKANPDGSISYNDKGKVVKPLGWKAPRYEDLINS